MLKKRFLHIACIMMISSVLVYSLMLDHTPKNPVSDKEQLAIEASSVYPLMDRDWTVKYHVKKQKVYIENFIPRFSFHGSVSQLPDQQDGYIAVFVNGRWKMNAHQSIFIIKNLNRGKNEITLKLKKKNGSNYGINKRLSVHVR
jgi:hypothetical protein